MKQILKGKAGSILLAVAAAAALVAVAWHVFDLGKVIEAGLAVRDIVEGRNVAEARKTLELLNDRQYVLERLQEAVEADGGTVRGKMRLLETLSLFSQPRPVRRALDARSLAAQRAACALLWGDKDHAARCAEIALAWLRDEGADERSTAAMICGRLNVDEARPDLLRALERAPRTPDELNLFRQAIYAIKDPKPPELVERLFAMVADPAFGEEARGAALDALERVKEGPRDRLLNLLLALLADPGTPGFLRTKAALGLGGFGDERAWRALEDVLLSEKEKDGILQRNCLYALGKTVPVDRLRQLLVDHRVYTHRYFGIRVDVATMLATLNVREPIALDILCQYLVDADENDTDMTVRSEAWLSLWLLTGIAFGVEEEDKDHFRHPPRPITQPEAVRDFFFRRAHLRTPTVTLEQATAAAKIAKDLARMQKARYAYGQDLKGRILAQWREEAEKAAQAKQEPQPVPQGPQLPEQGEGKGLGEGKAPSEGEEKQAPKDESEGGQTPESGGEEKEPLEGGSEEPEGEDGETGGSGAAPGGH